jgi:hypothetical protein
MSIFTAEITPLEMLERGVFGGAYFSNATLEDLGDLQHEVQVIAEQQVGQKYDVMKNEFRVKAGQDFETWSRNGWIFEEDPLGWSHWYCRYSAGRRHFRDSHQIQRWHNYAMRWKPYLVSRPDSKVIAQGLLQWGIDPLMVS